MRAGAGLATEPVCCSVSVYYAAGHQRLSYAAYAQFIDSFSAYINSGYWDDVLHQCLSC